MEKAKAILHLRSQQPKKPGDDFNIFAVLQLNEVDHCRMLFELLDPKGSHGMGDCFLRSFFDMVLKNLIRPAFLFIGKNLLNMGVLIY